ncbi:MAG: 4Fe-4S binding protein [archaeon]
MAKAKVDPKKCTGCQACVNTCPVQAISMVKNKAKVDPGACIGCGACVSVCPSEAISMVE